MMFLCYDWRNIQVAGDLRRQGTPVNAYRDGKLFLFTKEASKVDVFFDFS